MLVLHCVCCNVCVALYNFYVTILYMLFNYNSNKLKNMGSPSKTNTNNTVKNMNMSASSSARCGGFSMRGTMHTKSNPKKKCGGCG